MPLYAVCLAGSVGEDQLISVIEADSKEEAIRHHFRKYVCVSETMREFIVDLTSDGLYFYHFDGNLDSFKKVFGHVDGFVELIEQTIKNWEEASEENNGYIPKSVAKESEKLLTDEMCIAVADYLLNHDRDSWARDIVAVEVEIERI